MSSPRKEICIVIAGRPASGKSTALNNIFGLPLENGAVIGDTGTIRMTNIVIGGEIYLKVIDFKVTDPPGFGDLEILTEDITRDMVTARENQDYTLLYCINVGADNQLPPRDVDTISTLQQILGEDVWEKCVILFTFSDTARKEYDHETDTGFYKEYLKVCSVAFQVALTNCGVTNLAVTTIFESHEHERIEWEGEHNGLSEEEEEERELSSEEEEPIEEEREEGEPIREVEEPIGEVEEPISTPDEEVEEPIGEVEEPISTPDEEVEELIAIPVGATNRVEENILPNVPNSSDWTNLVFLELMRKTEGNKRINFILLKFGNARGAQFVARYREATPSISAIAQFIRTIENE